MSSVNSQLEKFGLKSRDGVWAGGLLLVLVLVFFFDLGRKPSQELSSTQPPPKVTKTEQPVETTTEVVQPLKLAVTTSNPQYDEMGALLQTLGKGYSDYKTVTLDELLDPGKLREIDVVFATCSPLPAEWGEKDLAGGDEARPNTFQARIKAEVIERIKENLQAFVKRGGTLYASDWQFSLLRFAFPEFVDYERAIDGDKQTVIGTATDESLRKVVGDRLELKFDLSGWKPAAFKGREVSVLLRGDYKNMNGQTISNAPLLIKFPFGKGTVIFTSFHNEKQNSELETKLLKYLVFTTILAKTEATMSQTLVQGGFKQTGRSLLSVSGGAQSVTETYQSEKSTPIRFSLGFENNNAKMKLTIIGPDGKKYEKEGASPLDVDIPDGGIGNWEYTITAVKTPFDNFPYALTIGQK